MRHPVMALPRVVRREGRRRAIVAPRLSLLAALAAVALCGCASSTARPASASASAAAPTAKAGDSTVIIVAATTDVHGRLRGWDYYADAADTLRGLTRSATIVDSVRKARPGHVVLVDAGDLLQGNPLTYVAARIDTAAPHPVIAAMNAMQYDAAALGNHEFNYGLPTLDKAVAQATFPFLSANTFRTNGQRAYPASTVVQRGGVRIGIVGATTPGVLVWDRDNVAGRLQLKDIVTEVGREVQAVRRRSDAVVVVVHSGLGEPASYDTVSTGLPSENVGARIAREVPGVHLIVIGHSHKEVADTAINGVTIVQARNWATSVALATMTLTHDGAAWTVARTRGQIVRDAGHAEHPAVLAVTQRAHEQTVRWVNQTLGTTPVPWRADSARVRDTPLIDFILETQRQAAGTDLASTAAFDIGASLDAGPVTVAEVARLYPYDNTLRAVRITGKQLREYLEYSSRYYRTAGTPEAAQSPTDPTVPGYNFDIVAGADYTIDISRPIGSRVTRLQVKGRDVADTDSFTLALNNYRQTGGGGYAMLRDAPLIYDKQEEIRDLLIAEVRRRGTLRPDDFAVRNWALEPSGAADAAYRGMHASAFDASGTTRRPSAAANRLTSGRWLRVIATNDFHGAFEARADNNGVLRGGAPWFIGAIEQARRECQAPTCASLWLDGGDEFQGTPASNITYGASVVSLFARHGLVASALGNHEFDWGVDSLKARMRQAPYAILGANVTDSAGRDVPWIRNDTLVDVQGVRVGVIGVATVETPTTTKATNVVGLRFTNPARVVDERARALRARGAHVVVVIAHAGAFCDRRSLDGCNGEIVDLANAVTEKIDAIVSGHTHSGVATRVKGIPIVQAYSRGSAVGVIDIPLSSAEAPPVIVRNVWRDSVAADRPSAAYTDSVLARANAIYDKPVAEIAERMNAGASGTLGNLIADAFRTVGKGDVGLMNSGGVRAPLYAGWVTLGKLFEVEPFGNSLMRVHVLGRDLRRLLEEIVDTSNVRMHLSGVKVTYDPARPAGQRVTSLTFSDGRPVNARQLYTLVTLDFILMGGDGLSLAKRAAKVVDLRMSDLDALAQYLRTRPQPVRAPSDARLIPLSKP